MSATNVTCHATAPEVRATGMEELLSHLKAPAKLSETTLVDLVVQLQNQVARICAQSHAAHTLALQAGQPKSKDESRLERQYRKALIKIDCELVEAENQIKAHHLLEHLLERLKSAAQSAVPA